MRRALLFVLAAAMLAVGSSAARAASFGPTLPGRPPGLPGRGSAAEALPLPTPSPPDLTPPQIDQAPSQIFYGRAFTIVTRDAGRVVKVSILSVGGGAHSATLGIISRTPNTLLVQGPASPDVAPPGQYLLFIYANGPAGPIPSLPALVTLSAPPAPSPTPTNPSGKPRPSHSPTSGATGGSGGGGGGRGGPGGSGGGPGASGQPGQGSGRTQGGPAALASPARVDRSLGTEVWLGMVLLVIFLATFLGLRRMLRA